MAYDIGDVLFLLKRDGQTKHEEAVSKLIAACIDIIDKYKIVASGKSKGAGGCFFADGKGTLDTVQIDVQHLEALALLIDEPVYDRTLTGKKAQHPS